MGQEDDILLHGVQESERVMPIFNVRLNGTDKNPYLDLYGLVQNPFPQVAKYEYMAFCHLLNNLAAIPIPNESVLLHRLKGCTQEFIDLCVSLYEPGKMVEFEIKVKET